MKKTVSLNIEEDLDDFLNENFGTRTDGFVAAVEILRKSQQMGFEAHEIVENLQFLQQIRRTSLREIKGVFTPDEWKFMVDILNGTLITPEFRCLKEGLIAEMEDAEHFDNSATRWNLNLSEVLEKIKKLTGAQIEAIYFRIEEFWNDDKRDLEKFAEW
jgi:hypothetical protein